MRLCHSGASPLCPHAWGLSQSFEICPKVLEQTSLLLPAGIAAAQWLALRLQSVAAVLVTLVALLAVLGHEHLLPFATGSSKFAASELPYACLARKTENRP